MTRNPLMRLARLSLFVLVWTAAPSLVFAQRLSPIVYTVRVPAPETHYIEVEATVPTSRRAAIEMMMPVWSPGYYRIEDYAARVDNVTAKTTDGKPLEVTPTAHTPRGGGPGEDKAQKNNRWQIQTNGQAAVVLSYRVFCNQRSVTTNYVDSQYGVLNGAPTFMTLVERARRPHEVRIELPPTWKRAMSGLDDAPDRKPNHFRAADYETLVDSPIMAGDLLVREFTVAGKPHYVVGAGDVEGWDADAATRDLETYVKEVYRFWGFLPYEKYAFLLMFRQGGGGLEHKNSNLSTVSARPPAGRGAGTVPAEAPSQGRRMWGGVGLLSHEYFHLFNVKRLRPVELGPFDFEKAPTTGSLWISEGVTSYYSSLLVERAGLRTEGEYLASLSSLIGGLQTAPGRLLQSVEQSSLDVWNNSNSGVNPNANTVSYYNKGNVLGLLLDARIRRATEGRKSFDDVMRLAYKRYGGDRGFTPDEFRATAEEIAAGDLKDWFKRSVSSVEELDYTDLLEWYGLRFTSAEGPAGNWKIERLPDATEAQKRNLKAWLTGR
jgi:predicted metalloprotease with PDZ domain